MEKIEKYKIPFVGLKNRVHHFEYQIDDSFFIQHNNLDLKNCAIEVKVELDKRENYLLFIFYIDGHLFLDCDRCLDEYQQEIFGDYKLIAQLGGKLQENNDNEDDIIAISKNADYIDIAKPIYDYILLSIPYQHKHSNIEDCNQEMVAKMLKKEFDNKKEIDPRWEILNKLKK